MNIFWGVRMVKLTHGCSTFNLWQVSYMCIYIYILYIYYIYIYYIIHNINIYVVWSKPAPSHHQQPSQLSLLQANLLKPAAGKTCNYWLLMGNTYNGNTRCGGKTIQHATNINKYLPLHATGHVFFQRTAGNCTWYCIQNSKWPHSVGLGCLYLYYTWHMPRCKGHRVIAIEMLSNKLQQILQWYRSVRHWACKAMYGSRKSWSLWFLRMSLILSKGGRKAGVFQFFLLDYWLHGVQ